MSDLPPPLPKSLSPERKVIRTGFITGLAIAVAPILLGSLAGKDGAQGGLIASGIITFLSTLLSAFLAIFASIRNFALGMLLGSGISLLILVAICGGLLAR